MQINPIQKTCKINNSFQKIKIEVIYANQQKKRIKYLMNLKTQLKLINFNKMKKIINQILIVYKKLIQFKIWKINQIILVLQKLNTNFKKRKNKLIQQIKYLKIKK